ncbi:PIG-L deacetylase family protein [Allopontixanthobacter sediminis]|uniref:PIG-L family deacetylase n=1 Tax=Allopontixanthobacter sediminis TaxID=1689985 RepID=A0A845B1N3_9SPHN|nr:PIG-L deacetylase family protein [Allopontixanthobacter sediminis]MXP44340.1 PIG-L family deacetylase [Allopontixanthobacter sediminis]
MNGLNHFGKVLAIAPHPDDEVLGCGGTLVRLVAEGHPVTVAVATTGRPPHFAEDQVQRVAGEMRRAHAVLGVRDTRLIGLPAAAMDTLPASETNAAFGQLIDEVAPDTLLLPFIGDIHLDHQLTFLAAMVASRPRHDKAPSQILCYETLSETNWYAPPTTPAFVPNVFIDIEATLDRKLEAFSAFESQVRPFPEERSVEAIKALARLRGATVHLRAAEAFMTIRQILR